MLSNKEIVKQFKKHKREAGRGLAYQKKQDEINQAFFAGNPLVKFEMKGKEAEKPMVSLYRCQKVVTSVLGFLVQLRRKPDYQAVIENSEEQKERSDYLNGVSDYFRKNGNAPQIETKQDLDLLIQGYGAVDTNITYIAKMADRVPGGEIKYECCTDEVNWDPNARETNLTDARYVYRSKKMPCEDAELLFGAEEEDLEGVADNEAEMYTGSVGKYKSWDRRSGDAEDMCIIHYYQWWDYEPYYQAPNPIYNLTDDIALANLAAAAMAKIKARREMERDEYEREDLFMFDPLAPDLVMDKEMYKDIKTLFGKLNIEVEFTQYYHQCYYTAILSGDKVFTKFKSPDQQGFTIKFKTGYFDKINKCWFSIASMMRQPANYANKALTEMMYVIASNSKGGVMYEKTAVPDAARFESEYASTKAAIVVNDGALSQGRIQPKAVAALPTGYENILAESKNALMESTGANPEFLGSSENKQVSALLEKQRIKQASSALAPVLDSIMLYQIENGRLVLTYIRIITENNPGRLIPMLGEDGSRRFSALMQDKFADEYQVDVGEAPETAAEKEEAAKLLTEMAMSMLPYGVNIYPDIIPELPIKSRIKKALIERITPQPGQPDPVAEAAKVKQVQLMDAELLYKQAGAKEKEANAMLKVAQVESEGANLHKTAVETARLIKEPIKQPEQQQFNQPYGA